METPKATIHPESVEAEVLALALEDWRLNAGELNRPADEARLRALYDAAVADGLELPYERRGEVEACQTTRVVKAMADDSAAHAARALTGAVLL